MTSFDATGFPLRGLAPDAAAARLAEWVRWPIDRGTATDVKTAGRTLRIHVLDAGEGIQLRTVVEMRKRVFLPAEEIVCFFPAFTATAERSLDLLAVESTECPLEPFGVTAWPERLRFRIANPFDFALAAGVRIRVALALLASRVEGAPEGTRFLILPTSIASQDPEVPPGIHTATGRVEEILTFRNAATCEDVRRLRLSTPSGPLDIVASARDAVSSLAAGSIAVAEGELVATVRAVE